MKSIISGKVNMPNGELSNNISDRFNEIELK